MDDRTKYIWKNILVILSVLSIIILIIAAFLGLFSCSKKVSYSFFHETEEISEIQIINFELVGEGKKVTECWIEDCVVVSEIEDISEFINRFVGELQFFLYREPPLIKFKNGDYAIKVIYNNGDIELIGYQASYSFDRDAVEHDGFILSEENFGHVYCSEKSFMKFINSFLESPILN